MKIHFLYLTAFCVTGGIEKFNKAFIKALSEISIEQDINFKVLSAYDTVPDERYISKSLFKGYGKKRLRFTISSLKAAGTSDFVILGHINLAPVGLLLKVFNPKVKLLLIAHGTEVWDKVSLLKSMLLKKCYRILAVSSYTKKRIAETHKIPSDSIIVFYNTIDPYFKIPEKFEKPGYLMVRYGITSGTKVILTVARIRYTEGYKGYDQIIRTLTSISKKIPRIKYILVGGYDPDEKERINNLIKENSVEDFVLLPGFAKEEELTDHYLLADLFVMPSKKEGFGIVFIEALTCGLPVIAGNKDGSVDALKNGELGTLVDPDKNEEVRDAVIKNLDSPCDKKFLSHKVIEIFGFEKYKARLREILASSAHRSIR